ncbi:unnamed protein product [Bemisia tabaci]|uniref:Uncharacterized protein n=1 Tax=Bemisia tabaci TaxID=7038 RepID=A0A9N9ZZR8_BEMTA|nr:unnamed protein product [Bemisia tabaci]
MLGYPMFNNGTQTVTCFINTYYILLLFRNKYFDLFLITSEASIHVLSFLLIDLILWGDRSTLLGEEDENVVISISNAIKSSYMDQNQLSLAWNSHVDKNPESSEATKLYTWLIERKDLD